MSDKVYPDEYDLTPVEIPKVIGGERYMLIEPTEAVAARFQSANVAAARFDDGKVTRMEGIAESRAILVAGCLALTDKGKGGQIKRDEGGEPMTVALGTVKRWPARVIKPLFEQARELGGLDEEPTTEPELAKAVADLEKQLDKRKRELAALRNGKAPAGEERVKNSHGAGTDTSA